MGFDLFILAILVVTTIRGAAKGVAWQLAGIAAVVLCFMFATPLSLTIAPLIKLDPPLNRWVAMLGIYIVFAFGTFAVARGFREALEKAKFVEFDRHLGALFGLFKGAAIALVITFFAVAMSPKTREYVLTTKTGFAAAHVMNALDPVMPKELHAILEPYIHHLDAVDPDLAAQRAKHHEDLYDDAEAPPSNPQPGRGYRPTQRDADQFESEDQRVAPRDTFPDESPFESTGPSASKNPSRLGDPELEPDLADPSNSALNFDWLTNLPNLASKVTPAIKQQLYEAFENTPEEHRDELIDTLKKTNLEHLPQVARTWKRGRPVPPAIPRSEDEQFDVPEAPRIIKRPRPETTPDFTEEPDPTLETPPEPLANSVNNAPRRRNFPPRNQQPDENPERVQPVGNRQQLLQGIAKIFSSRATEQAQKMTEVETLMLGLPDEVIDGTLDDWLADLRGSDPDPDPQTDLTTNLNVRIARQVESQQIPHTELAPEWQTKLSRFFRN